MPSLAGPGTRGTRAELRHTPTCLRFQAGRRPSSAQLCIVVCSTAPIGIRRQPSMGEARPDSEDTLRFLLDYLGDELDPSILIGGWATHLRVGGEISYDIDFIVTTESRHRVQQVVPQVTDNNIHQGRKFSGELEGVHLDIYIPHESQLGMRLQLKVEALSRYVDR